MGTAAPCGSNRSTRVCGNRRRTWSMAPRGRTASVRVTWHQAASAPTWRGSASRSSRVPRRTARGRWTGACDLLDDGLRAPEVDEEAALGVAPLAERHGHRRPAVADRVGDGLPAVQVAEGGVVDAVEDVGADDRTRRRRRCRARTRSCAAPGDEGVRHHDRAAAAARRRRRRTRSIAARSTASWVRSVAPSGSATSGGLEVGEGVDGDVAEHDRPPDVGRRRCGRGRRRLEETRGEPEAGRGVVVAAGDHDPGAGVDEPVEGLDSRATVSTGGQGPVVDVAADHDDVDPLGPDRVDQVVEVGSLRTEQPDTVERPSQVPVGGVEEPHGDHARRAVRQSW